SADDLFDLFGREVLGQLGKPPLRHSRDGPCEVTLRLAAQEEKTEEGAQGRHHQAGHPGTTGAGVSKKEAGNVAGSQLPKTKWLVPEAFDDETPNERPIPRDRHRGKAALFLEVVLIPLLECLQRGLIQGRHW